MRGPSTPKVAALSELVKMPYLVSTPALARCPSAHLIIIRNPALAVLLRTAVARQGDALSTQAARQSCSCTWACICTACRVAQEARRASAGRAAPHLLGLCGRRGAWERLVARSSAPCPPTTQPTRTAPSVPLLGRARGRWGPSAGCMRDSYHAKRKIEEMCAT